MNEMKEKENEREMTLFPAPFSPKEKDKERERAELSEAEEQSACAKNQTAGREAAGAAEDLDFDLEKFVRYFNSRMPPGGIPKILWVRGGRKQALYRRLREFGKRALLEMVNRAARSEFLNGGGDRGWRADIDWLLRPNVFPRVVEGRYDNSYIRRKDQTAEREAQRRLAREVEAQIHRELQESIRRREQRAVTYEEYLRLKEEGRVPEGPEP